MIALFKQYLQLSVESLGNKTEEVKRIMCINVILLFIAHATITDSSEPGCDLDNILKK